MWLTLADYLSHHNFHLCNYSAHQVHITMYSRTVKLAATRSPQNNDKEIMLGSNRTLLLLIRNWHQLISRVAMQWTKWK
jgi:hypothetical protein